MSKTKQIEKQIKSLREKQNRIENEAFNKATAKVDKLIGKTFVYRNNCYSCSEPHEHWDVFRQIRSIVRKDGYLIVLSTKAEVDFSGKAQVEIEASTITKTEQVKNPFGGGWTSCSVEEFNDAYNAALSQFNHPLLAEKYERAQG